MKNNANPNCAQAIISLTQIKLVCSVDEAQNNYYYDMLLKTSFLIQSLLTQFDL